jgi:WD40 repeat protein
MKCPRCGTQSQVSPLPGLVGICASCLAESVSEAEGPFAEAWLPGPQTPLPRRLADYELQREIARGGMGVVYLARQLTLNRQVAVKLLLPGFVASPTRLARFRSEATLAARLQHPGIVAIHEIGEHEGVPYFSMEFVEGRDLGRIVRDQVLSARQTARVVRTVSRAIQYAHERGVLHRDLKPSNVLITPEGEPRVTDFGLAKPLDPDAELTLSGEILGSPSFMAPEQAAGQRDAVDVRTDVYGLGSLLYYTLTGRAPFVADTVSATLQQVLLGNPVPPHLVQPGVPTDLETITLRCLAREPRHRYGSAAEVADELDRYLSGTPILAQAPGLTGRLWRWARREPTLAGWAATAVVLAASLLGGSFAFASQRELARQRDEQRRDVAEMHRYVADVSLASRALEDGNTRGSLQLLQGLRPNTGETDRRGFEWHWLHARTAESAQQTWWQGDESVDSLSWSPDGRRLALAQPHTIRVIAPVTGRVFASHRLGGPPLRRIVAFDRLGGHVFVGDRGGLRRIELTVGRTEALTTEAVEGVAVCPDGPWLAVLTPAGSTGGESTDVLILDEESGEAHRRLEGLGGPALTWIPGVGLQGVASDGRFWRWNPEPGLRQLGRIVGRPPLAAAFTRDGLSVASLDSDGQLRLRETQSGRVVRERPERPHRDVKLEFSADGSRLAMVGGTDQRVTLFLNSTGEVEHRWTAHTDAVTTVIFPQSGRNVVTAGQDGSVRAWSPGASLDRQPWQHSCGLLPPQSTQFSPDARWVAGLWRNNSGEETALWSLSDPEARPVTLPGRPVSFAPDGRFLLQWEVGGTLRLWDITNGTETVSFQPNPRPGPWPDQLSPDGRIFACLGWDLHLRLYHATTAEELPAPVARIHQAIFSPDSRWVGYATEETVGLFQVAPPEQFHLPCADVQRLAFSPDARYLAAGQGSGRIQIFSVQERRWLVELSGHSMNVRALSFSPDGRTLASSGEDAVVRWWHVPAWRELVHQPQSSPAQVLAYSLDGQHLLAGLVGEYRVMSTAEKLAPLPVPVVGGFWTEPVVAGGRLTRKVGTARR